jgi:PEP-CTERM motif
MNTPSLIPSTLCAAALLAASAAHAGNHHSSNAAACSASVTNVSWTDCAGSFEGNDKNQEDRVLSIIESEFGLAGASFLGASDDARSGPFRRDPDGASGTLRFDSAIDGAFVLSLKAGNAFSLYFFDGEGDAISSIDYTTLGVATNWRGDGLGLSHASLYAAVPAIPEPETYALMLAGLAAVGFMSRRRKPQA